MNIQIGDIAKSSFWPEPIKILSVNEIGENYIKIEAVGTETKKYYDFILPLEDYEKIEIVKEKSPSFDANGEEVFLFIEATRIRNAYLFDPLYAINVSQIDPLPHQIDAVYNYILKNPRIRFLLADDPGAGKTIMTGLLIKELKYRGLVERILIIVPGHLKDQWLREMKEKFSENFSIVDRNIINSEWGRNVFKEKNQVIISMDFAKQDNVMSALKDSMWDLCIVDEAHKLSAYKYGDKINKTQRYYLGELIRDNSNHLIFLTATPHRGDTENFRLLLDLLEPGFFATAEMLSKSIQNKDNPLFLRRLKEDLKDFNGAPLFPPRKVETVKFRLSDDEKILYNEVTHYVEEYYNKAIAKEKRNVAFALTILQRRMASSLRAIRKSLERRYKRLAELYEKGKFLLENNYYSDIDDNNFEDLEEQLRWQKEEEFLEKLTSSENLEELKQELEKLNNLVNLAKITEKKEIETKLNELKKVITSEGIQNSNNKLLIFTESKDTLEYLVEKIKNWGYSVTYIHGGMNLDERIKAEAEFKNNAQIMVSTEAGGEGINLQFCSLMVNYDIPWNPNRLEQRMGRIHRYGQRYEVHIYNLVAVDTREGKILESLFEKLERIQEHFGSDRVFDVIGEVFVGKSLKDLLLEAISNQRTLDDIINDIMLIPDEEAINKVKEITTEALATRHIDLTRILKEERQAKENRLVPEYLEEFFKKASKLLNIKTHKDDKSGFWHVSDVPIDIRVQNNEFKNKFGEIQRQYKKITFDKSLSFKTQSEFVAMGHPLLEGIIETIFKKYADKVQQGAIFEDPDGKKDGYIWFFETEIRDGKDEIAGKKLFAVYQDKSNNLSFINSAILWDLKPLTDNPIISEQKMLDLDNNKVLSFLISEGIKKYKNEILEKRKRNSEIKEKYGIKSLESMITNSESKLLNYEIRKKKNEQIPDVIIQNEEKNRENLSNKLEKLKKDIEAEQHLKFSVPKNLGIIRVVPQPAENIMVSDKEVENIGMNFVMDYERKNGRIPQDVSEQNLGYDIVSQDNQENYRYIEVKTRAKDGKIILTPNEWIMAQRLKDEYWLYVVINAISTPELYTIQNPASRLTPYEEINIIRYIVDDWKTKSIKIL